MSVNPEIKITTKQVESADLVPVLNALDANGREQHTHDQRMATDQHHFDFDMARETRAHEAHEAAAKRAHEAAQDDLNRRTGLITKVAALAAGTVLMLGAYVGVARPLIRDAVKPEQTANIEAVEPKTIEVIMWIDPATGKATIENSNLITTELAQHGMDVTQVNELLDSMKDHPNQDISADARIPNDLRFTYTIVYGADTNSDGTADTVQEMEKDNSPKAPAAETDAAETPFVEAFLRKLQLAGVDLSVDGTIDLSGLSSTGKLGLMLSDGTSPTIQKITHDANTEEYSITVDGGKVYTVTL